MDRIVEGFLVAANAGIQSAESPCCPTCKDEVRAAAITQGLHPRSAGECGSVKGAFWPEMCAALDMRTASLSRSVILLLERLVGPEADDGQSQRIDGQLIVLHVVAEDIGHAGGPSLPLEFCMIRRVRVHLLELNPRRIR